MVLSTWQSDRSATFYLQGDLDIVTAPALHEAIEEALDAGAEELVFDGSRVEFVDLRGLHPILHARRRLRETDDATRVFWVRPALCVRRLLEASGLDTLLPSAVSG